MSENELPLFEAEALAAKRKPKKAAKVHQFTCAQCGSAMHYHTGERAVRCVACGHSEAIEVPAGETVSESPLDVALKALKLQPLKDVPTHVQCSTCGATSPWYVSRLSDVCPYCQTPMAKQDTQSNHLPIEAIVPFEVDKKTALKHLGGWMKKRWFAPNVLKEMAGHSKEFQGVYVPHWTFDSLTETDYNGQRGEHYIDYVRQTRTVNGKSETVTVPVQKTRWYPAAGRVRVMFDDVLILAAMFIPKAIVNGLRPWCLESAQPYTPEYLAGLKADYYQLDLGEAFEVAKQRMSRDIHLAICRDIGGDVQRVLAQSTQYRDSTYKLLMLPVWYSGFEYRGKIYQTVINGQTGKVAGQYPKSPIKIALAVAGGLLALGAAALVYYYWR